MKESLSLPVLIGQHTSPNVESLFSVLLRLYCTEVVKEAEDNDGISTGSVYISLCNRG
ncbi:chemotaxis protein CheB [Halodesulfovibrio marinisediminis]|uniref:chemotaxis protein CheB n=1 Tax=Halodesulfovibrio marinisediminis TaxID=458711 RepID=UPI0011152B1B